MFKRFLMFAIALIAGAALAIDVRSGDTVAFTSPTTGTMIGVGSFQDGTLSLRIVEDFDGFARMTIRSTDGVSVTYDVFVDESGIRVIQGTAVQELRSALEAAGIAVSVQGVDAEAVRNAAATFEGARGEEDGDDRDEDDGRDEDDDDDRDDADDLDDDGSDDDRDDGDDDRDDARDDGDDDRDDTNEDDEHDDDADDSHDDTNDTDDDDDSDD